MANSGIKSGINLLASPHICTYEPGYKPWFAKTLFKKRERGEGKTLTGFPTKFCYAKLHDNLQAYKGLRLMVAG